MIAFKSLLFLQIVLLILLCNLHFMQGKQGEKLQSFSLEKANALKGIMAILIVITHIGNEFSRNGLNISSFTNFGAVCVSTFFFISGYGLIKSYKKNGEDYLKSFFSRRFIKLLPPIVIATSLWLFVKCMFYGYEIGNVFTDFSDGITPLPNSWFIYIIMLLYPAFYFTMKIRHYSVGGVFITIGVSVANCLCNIFSKLEYRMVQ